jgi:hypothetical protein
MRATLFLAAFASVNAVADSDEILIEQLIRRPAPASKATAQRPAKTDPASALLGQPVRVRTFGNGLYLGTLTAVDSNAIHLDIAVSDQVLAYALPRSAIEVLEPIAGAAP